MKKNRANGWQDQIKIDFSADSDLKESLRAKLLFQLESQGRINDDIHDIKEGIPMKRTIKNTTRVAIIAAIMLVLMSATALAVSMTLSLGPFAHYIADDDQASIEEVKAFYGAQRDEWAGKVFNQNGEPIDDLLGYLEENGEQSSIYDAQGSELYMDIVDGRIVFTPRAANEEVAVTRFATLEEAQPYISFSVEMPAYIPDGYTLDCFEVFNDKDGSPRKDSKYMTAVYTKAGAPGGEMYIQFRLMDEETAYGSSGGQVQEIQINDHAAVTNGSSIDMLVGDVMYMFLPAKSGVVLDELLKMAESVQE